MESDEEVKVDRRSLRTKRVRTPSPERSAAMRALFADPHYLAMRKKLAEENAHLRRDGSWTRAGVPDGWTKDKAQKAHARARRSAEKTVKKMIENDVLELPELPDDAKAYEEALVTTIAVMRDKVSNRDLKLKAARQVMEWTKAKPESARKISVQSAEDWLAAVIAGEQKE